MSRRSAASVSALLVPLLALLLSPWAAVAKDATPADAASPVAGGASIEVLASGLTNPRGFGWGPNGTLHLALAGTGGNTRIEAAEGFTVQIGLSSSVVTVADGCATPVVMGLVSMLWEEAGWIWGAMDVSFLDDQLYVLLSGAGPSNLSPASFSGVFRVHEDGTMTLVADVTTWLPMHPPAFIPPDYGTDGSLFDLEVAGDGFLLSEAVGGQLLSVALDGSIATVADLSEGHLVPTGIAVDAEGNAFVGFETTPPYEDGASKVVKVTPNGTVTDHWTGLTAVTDVAFGPDGVLYAAEMATVNTGEEPFLRPDSGRIVRQAGPDSLEPVVTELPYPVGIGFDTDGRLVFSAPAFGPDGGVGQGVLLAVDPGAGPVSYGAVEIPDDAACG